MFYKLKNTLGRSAFKHRSRGILDTPAIRPDKSAGFALLSQIRHDDMQMYLLAIKSFAFRLAPASVFIVDDGSLTEEDIRLLEKHVPGHTLLSAPSIGLSGCPKGGTWERLISIVQLVGRHYVIQLDADTVTLSDIPEVARCVADNRSFSIGTWDNQESETMTERIKVARTHALGESPHIQIVAEANMAAFEGYEGLRYIRGCSGFSGFAKASITPARLSALATQMGAVLGKRWSEWGTEQFMSNVIVANSDNPVVLPHPKYCDCTRYTDGNPAFVHFIGTCRFAQGRYAGAAQDLIKSLSSNPESLQ